MLYFTLFREERNNDCERDGIKMYDVVIIGGGPAGLTAAVYARRAGKTVLVIEKSAFGGQITWSPKVENFPGYGAVTGTELGDRLLEQAMEQGAEVELEEIAAIEAAGDRKEFLLRAESGACFSGKTVIFAGGAKPRMTGLPREEDLIGNGVCFCAVCDGAFYRNKTVAVYGGGNSALQDALLLADKCSEVYLIHRRTAFRGESRLVDSIKEKKNIHPVLNATIIKLQGEKELTGVVLEQNGVHQELAVQGLFVAIGHLPDNGIIAPFTALDEKGYAVSGENCTTETPGLFVAGDCRTKSVRQVTTACADGAVAALAACRYLDELVP